MVQATPAIPATAPMKFRRLSFWAGVKTCATQDDEYPRRCVKDRGEARRQMGLPPGDQGKGQGVVAEAEQRERGESLAAPRRRGAGQRSARPQDEQPRAQPLSAARVKGGSSFTATPMKKNDPPHNRDRRARQAPFARRHRALRDRHRRLSNACSGCRLAAGAWRVRPIPAV